MTQINNAHQPLSIVEHNFEEASPHARTLPVTILGAALANAAKKDLLTYCERDASLTNGADATIPRNFTGVTTVITKINEEHFALCRLPE